MNPVIALVILSGAMCQSPLEHKPNETVAHKTQCAIVIRAQSANPFKMVQEQNALPAMPPIPRAKPVPVPKYDYKPKKKTVKKTAKKSKKSKRKTRKGKR